MTDTQARQFPSGSASTRSGFSALSATKAVEPCSLHCATPCV